MNQMWFEDMMKQMFNEDICFNPTKLIILDFLSQDNLVKHVYKKKNVAEYVYEVYIDNPVIAERHSSYVVRKLGVYGVSDIESLIDDALESWMRDADNNILRLSNGLIYLDIDEKDGVDIGKNTQRLCKMLYKKHFGDDLPKPMNIIDIVCLDDNNIDEFGTSIYRNRIFEDMQYCPICEEINMDELVAVHIMDKSQGISCEQFIDKNNGLIFCRKHALDYINHIFEFNELGFVADNDKDEYQQGMHLGFVVRNKYRKKYLEQRWKRYGKG